MYTRSTPPRVIVRYGTVKGPRQKSRDAEVWFEETLLIVDVIKVGFGVIEAGFDVTEPGAERVLFV